MFNIVKHRDFMLADDLPTWQEAEHSRLDKYGKEYVAVQTCEPRDQEQNARLIEKPNVPEEPEPEPWWFWPMFAIGIIAAGAMAWGGG